MEEREIEQNTFQEWHYTPLELACKWRVSLETIGDYFGNEDGIVKIRIGGINRQWRMRIPESIARRVHERLCEGGD